MDHYWELYRKAKVCGYKHIGIYSAITPEYVPVDVQLVKRILTKDFDHFESHGLFHKKNDLSDNLFALDGLEWKDRRTKLTPIFTSGKIKMMFDVVYNKARGLSPVIQKHLDKGEPININDICARYTTDTIANVAFGLELDTLTDGDHEFLKIGKLAFKPSTIKFAIERTVPHKILQLIGYSTHDRFVTDYFTSIVRDTIKYRESHDVVRKDFMQLMIQLKNKAKSFVTDQEIISEAFIFYLGGFETSSSTMSFILFELARNPDIQTKLHNEILQAGNLNYNNLFEMKYLDSVIKETLRLYPFFPVLPRQCTKDYTVPGTTSVIRKGTTVSIPVIGIHRDPEFYPDPLQFNPDRFARGNNRNCLDATWLAFGDGPRQCIGLRFGLMQIKLGICELLKDFEFTLDDSMSPPFMAVKGSFAYMFDKEVMLRATSRM